MKSLVEVDIKYVYCYVGMYTNLQEIGFPRVLLINLQILYNGRKNLANFISLQNKAPFY